MTNRPRLHSREFDQSIILALDFLTLRHVETDPCRRASKVPCKTKRGYWKRIQDGSVPG